MRTPGLIDGLPMREGSTPGQRAAYYMSGCSPNPVSAYVRLLEGLIEPDEMFVPCWHWNRGRSRGRPYMAAAPHNPGHPVSYYYERPLQMTRICSSSDCVNPAHWVLIPKPPQRILHPAVIDAEEQIEKLQPKCLEDALRLISTPRLYIPFAYQMYRQRHMNFSKMRDLHAKSA